VVGFSLSGYVVAENGGTAAIMVNRTGATNQTVTVNYATSDGTATFFGAGADYVTSSGTLTFLPGITSLTFNVTVLDDAVVEGNEFLNLTLSGIASAPVGTATFGTSAATLTIQDNETGIQFSQPLYTALENAGALTVNVVRVGVTNVQVSASFQTVNGSAIAGLHYVPTNGALTFAPGVTNLAFSVRLIDDNLANAARSLNLVLSNAAGTTGTLLTSPSNATVLVLDNETAPPSAGSVDLTFGAILGADGPVYAVAALTNRQVYLGGEFFSVNGGLSTRVARLNTDGTLDPNFNPGVGPDSTVFALAADGTNKLVIGGAFTTVAGASRNFVARLNADGTHDATFDPGTGANNVVLAAAVRTNGSVLVGGEFTVINGQLRNSLALLTTNGAVDGTFTASANGAVRAIALQTDGRILIGGDFTVVNGNAAGRIARLNADGTLDATFNTGTGADGSVYGLIAQTNGQIVAVGAFANFAGQARAGVTVLNADGGQNGGFNPGTGANGLVRFAVPASGVRFFIAGNFTAFNGVTRNRVARINPDGTLDGTFNPGTGPDAAVNGMALLTQAPLGSGAQQGIGQQSSAGGDNFETGNLLRLPWVTGGAAPWSVSLTNALATNPPAGGRYHARSGLIGDLQSSALSLTTVLTNGTGTVSYRVSSETGFDFMRFTVNGSLLLNVSGESGWQVLNFPVASGPATLLFTYTKNFIFASGLDAAFIDNLDLPLAVPTGSTNVVDAGSTSGSLSLTFEAMGVPDNLRVYFGSQLLLDVLVTNTQVFNLNFGPGSSTLLSIVVNEGRQSGSGWSYTGVVTPNVGGAVGDRLVIGGDFLLVNGQPRSHVAQLNDDGSLNGGFGVSQGNTTVQALGLNTNVALPSLVGRAVVGGNFSSINGSGAGRVARLNGDGTLDATFSAGLGANGDVSALVVQADGRVVVGGYFTQVNGTNRTRLARLNVDGSLDLSFDTSVGANNPVLAMALQADGRVLVGGMFTSVNGATRNFVARLNVDGTVDPTFNTTVGANGAVRAIAVQPDGKILVAGDFTMISGASRVRVARLLGDGSVDGSFDVGSGADNFVNAIALDGSGRVLVGGSFTSFANVGLNRVARLGTNGVLDAEFSIGSGFDDFVSGLAVQPDGRILAVGGFTTFNGLTHGRVVRLTASGGLDATFNTGAGANNFIAAVQLQPSDGKILVGGAFSSFDGQPRNGIARLNGGENTIGNGSFEFSSAIYTVTENATNVLVTVFRRGSLSGVGLVNFSTVNGSALAGVHFTGVTNTLSLADGQNSAGVSITVLDNALTNANRTATLVLSGPSGASLGVVTNATLTILDDDSVLGFASSTFSANENATNAVIAITRAGGGLGAVSVVAYTTSGTAVPGQRYTQSTNVIVWGAGDTTAKTFLVPVINTTAIEGNQTVNLLLTNVAGAAYLGLSSAVLTIVDDDFGPGVLGFETNNFVVSETAGSVIVTVTRTNGSTGPVSAQFNTANSTGIAGVNYVATNGVLNFNDGQVTKTFAVQILNDGQPGANRTVQLILSNPTGGASLGRDQSFITILEADVSNGVIGFDASAYFVAENAGTLRINVLRTNGSQGFVTVNFTTRDGTARAGFDYVTAAGTLFFADGQTNTTLTIPILDDPLIESNEVINLSLSNPIGGATVGQGTATVTIIDDDTRAGSFQLTGAYFVRGTESTVTLLGSGMVNVPGALITVTRVGGSSGTVSVDFTTSDLSAIAGFNYLPTNGTLTFYDNEVAKSFIVPIIGTLGQTVFEVSISNPRGGAGLGTLRTSAVTIFPLNNTLKTGSGANFFLRENSRAPEDIGSALLPVNTTVNSTIAFRGGVNTFLLNAGSDYGEQNVDVALGGPSNFGGIQVFLAPINNDSIVEFNEDVEIVLITGNATADVCVLTVLCDDQPAGANDRNYNPDFDDVTAPPQNPTPGANNTVLGVAVQGDNRAVVVGDFTSVNALPRGRIARMTTNGAVDLAFDPGNGADGFVAAVGIDGSFTNGERIVIGGGFNSYNGVSRNGIARVLPNGGNDASFNPGSGVNGAVRALVVYGANTAFRGRVLVAGEFTSVNGTNRNRIARLNADGSLDTTFDPVAGANGTIHTVAIQSDGKVVIGGEFTTVNGTVRNGVARLNATGGLDLSFNPGGGADGPVRGLALDDGLPAIPGGTVVSTNVNRTASGGAAEDIFDVVVPLPPGSPPGTQVQGVLTLNYDFLALPDIINVYLGTNQVPASLIFTTGVTNGSATVAIPFGPSTNNVLRVIVNEGSGTLGTAWRYDLNLLAVVSATPLPVPAGPQRVVIGGDFNTFDLRRRGKVARLNADGSLDTSFDPGRGANDTVYSVMMDGLSTPILGGVFTDFNSTRRVGMVRLLANGTVDTSFMDTAYNQFAGVITLTNTDPKSFILSMARQSDGNIMIGGRFQLIGGGILPTANRTLPGFIGLGASARPATGFERSDKLAVTNTFPRADIRYRGNFTRIIGGSTPGSGNIEFVNGNYSIDETAGSLYVTLTRTNGNLGVMTAEFITTDPPTGPGAAAAGTNYVATRLNPTWETLWPGVLQISTAESGPNNLLRGPTDVFVSIINNTLVQGNLLVNQSLVIPSASSILGGELIPIGAALGRSASTITIIDDDFPAGVLGFSRALYSVGENGGSAVITVNRDNGASGAVSVNYTTRDPVPAAPTNAVAGLDYVLTTGTLSFGAGQTNNSFSVPIIDNVVAQQDRFVLLELFNAQGGASLGLTNARLQIIDDDFAPGRLNLTSTNYAVSETGGFATVTVTRTGGNVGALTVQFATSDRTAFAGVDFVAATGVLAWAASDSIPKSFNVPILDNTLVDGTRVLDVFLLSPSVAGALGILTNATVTIQDDDSYGTSSFAQPFFTVNENGGAAIITVVRNGGIAGPVSMVYGTIAGGTAVAGTHYTNVSGVLIMAQGQTSTNFLVPVMDNTLQDGNRTVQLLLSSPINTTLTFPSLATLTIVDDETFNTAAGSFDTTFGATGGNAAVYAAAVQANGYILVGGDFTSFNGVTFNRLMRLDPNGALDPAFNIGFGANAAVRALSVYRSGLNAGRILVGGFFTNLNGVTRNYVGRLDLNGGVDLSWNPGAGADNAVYALAIQSDERVVVGGAFSQFNGFQRNFISRLTTNGLVDTTFNPGQGANGVIYTVAVQPDGRVLAGGDFTTFDGVPRTRIVRLNADGSVDPAFNPGTGASSTVRSILVQPDSKILVSGSFTNFAGTTCGFLVRLNTDGTVDPAFNPAGIGADNAVYAMTLQGDGKVLIGGDFSRYNGVSRSRLARVNPDGSVDGSINIGTGANNFVATIVVQTDEKILIGGGFTQFNGQPRNYIARLNGGVLAGAGRLEFTSATYSVRENEGTAAITVRRTGGTSGQASVTLTTTDGPGATNGVHYIGLNSVLEFPTGETFVSTNLTIIDDVLVNPNRQVNLTLSSFVTAADGGQTNATLTIINDDGLLGFSAATYSVSEVVASGLATINVVRAGGASSNASVLFFTTTNGTATANLDYLPVTNVITFLPGETNKTISVPILDDNLIEGNETVLLQLTNLNGALPGQMTATLTIIDNDFAAGTVNFAAPQFGVSEGSNTVLALITVVRTNGTTGVISVDFATRDGTALAGATNDYIRTAGTLSFADGETMKTFSIPILADTVHETNETVNLELSSPTGGAIIGFQSTAILIITNNDILIYGNLVFSSATFTNAENVPSAVISVSRVGGSSGAVSVEYATTTNGTAIAGTHFTPVSGTLFWANGDAAARTFVVPVINNSFVDGNRTVQLVLSNAGGGSSVGNTGSATLVIVDDDTGPGAIGFQLPVVDVAENGTNAFVTLTRTNGSTGVVTARMTTFDLSARAGTDYVATNITVAFADGQTNATVLVAVLDNALQEGNRLFGMVITNTTGGAAVGLASTVVRIVDNEPAAGSVDAGFTTGTGANNLVYAVSTLTTNGGIIIAGDFTAVDGIGKANIARIRADGTVDTSFDPPSLLQGTNIGSIRSFAVYTNGINIGRAVIGGFFSSVGATPRTNIARLNADGGLDTSFDPGVGANNIVTAVAVQNNGRIVVAGLFTTLQGTNRNFIGRLNFDGTLDTSFDPGPGPDGPIRALAVQNDGRVLIGGDFSFVGGVPSRRLARLNADGTLDTTFVPGNTISTGSVYAISIQGDGRILVGGAFTATNGVTRSNLMRFELSGAADQTNFVAAGMPNDFVNAIAPMSDGRMVIGGGFTVVGGVAAGRIARLNLDGTLDTSINFGTGADNLISSIGLMGDGKIVIGGAFTNFNGTRQNHYARLNGGQNIGNGLVVFRSPVFTVNEAQTNALITIVRSGGLAGLVSVDYSDIAGGTAVPLVDYTPFSGRLTFQPGENTKFFTVTVTNDTLVKPTRTVFLALTNVTGGAAIDIPPTGVLNIEENDSSVRFFSSTYTASVAGTNALITLVRAGGTNEAVTVTVETADGTAVSGVDYVQTNGTVTFAPGVTNQTFVVPVLNPLTPGPNKTVLLTLTNPVPTNVVTLVFPTNAVLTLINNNFAPGVLEFALTNYVVAENVGFALVTVVRTNGSLGAVSVNFATSDGTAQAGRDYTTSAGTLSFADGETLKAFPVQILDNLTVSPQTNRSVFVNLTLSGATGGASLGLTNSVLTILDDDSFGTFVFGATNFTVLENAGFVDVIVNRVGGSLTNVTVDFNIIGGTATAGLDFLFTNSVLFFAQGEVSKAVRITILDDLLIEGDETISIVLSNATQGALLGNVTNATVLIGDNDLAFTFDPATLTVDEDGTNAVVNVLRSGVTNVAATVTVTTRDGTATNGVHYVGVTNVLVFPVGVTNATFVIPILDNLVQETNRFVNLLLSAPTPSGASSIAPGGTNVLVIVDNDSVFNFEFSTYTVNENAGLLTVNVLRVGQNRGEVSVVYSTVNGTAVAPLDFIAQNQTLRFPPGVSNASFQIPIVNDTLGEGPETFSLLLSNPLPASAAYLGPASNAVVTIVDDDVGMSFSASAYGVSKTNAITSIPVLRKGVTNLNVTVNYVVTNGTAVSGLDFVATNGTLVFAPGIATNFINVGLITTSPSLGNRTVNLYLTNASPGSSVEFPSNAVLTILESPGTLGFASAAFSVSEAATNAVITVLRTGGSSGNVGVTARTSAGTATSGLDYVETTAVLNWVNGDVTPKTFLVRIVDDLRIETAETVNLTLSNPTGFAAIGLGSAILTIGDNDGPGGVDFDFNVGTGFNNSVFGVVQQTNGQLVAVGAFSSYNGSLSNATFVARLNTDGSLDTNFNRGSGPGSTVRAVARQADGRLVIGGDFTFVDGAANIRNRVARLNADGSLDTTFIPNTGANNTVFALALQTDGRVLIAGSFTSVSGSSRNRIARLNTSGTLDATFNPGTGAGGTINAIAVQGDGRILIAGAFTNYNGTTIIRVARLNANGTLDATFNPGAGPNGSVFALALQNDGKVLIGGLFTSVSGQVRGRLARLNADGSLDSAFNPVFDDAVLALVSQADRKLLVGGAYSLLNGGLGGPPAPENPPVSGGTNVFRICRLNEDGSLDGVFNPGTGANNLVYAIAQQADNRVVLGGDFTLFNGAPINRIVRLNGSSSAAIPTVLSALPVVTSAGGPVTVTFSGEPGRVYNIEASTNLVNWTVITTVTNSIGTIPVLDPNALGLQRRFYRIVILPFP